MSLPLFIVDAFADQAYSGNPAAVCLLKGPAGEDFMQQTAAEMNLSETAFLWPEAGAYRLRWFTPVTEVKLCGHATLASAHILWETGVLAPGEEARFHTLSGLLVARREAEKISLYFPPYELTPVREVPGLTTALGIPERHVSQIMQYADNLLVHVDQESMVRELKPDFTLLAGLAVRAVSVTAESKEEGIDFVSRFFAPKMGVNEDPVTGSAHTALGPYWAARLNRSRLNAYQASPRGGYLLLDVDTDTITLTGHAITILKGQLQVEPVGL
ncbi:PhzF family phenazine biosynthesis protein [Paenibacillus sp. GCM10012306]|uniref:PhzF family phenazine biosynthesis protein n=1 Tax=Paenibacillus sp. GCM10012306 TaxID=3317342 RepID=UPI003611CCD3